MEKHPLFRIKPCLEISPDRSMKFHLNVAWNFTFILTRNFTFAAWNFILISCTFTVPPCLIFHRYSPYLLALCSPPSPNPDWWLCKGRRCALSKKKRKKWKWLMKMKCSLTRVFVLRWFLLRLCLLMTNADLKCWMRCWLRCYLRCWSRC